MRELRPSKPSHVCPASLPRGVYISSWMAAAVPLEEGDFLQTFWQLSSTKEKEREDAARYLLVTLQKKQVSCSK